MLRIELLQNEHVSYVAKNIKKQTAKAYCHHIASGNCSASRNFACGDIQLLRILCVCVFVLINCCCWQLQALQAVSGCKQGTDCVCSRYHNLVERRAFLSSTGRSGGEVPLPHTLW